MGAAKEIGKQGVLYLLGSHCLLASPGWVCSSVTAGERQEETRRMRRQRNIKKYDALTSKHIVFHPEPSGPLKKIKIKNKALLESLSQIAGKMYEGKRKKEMSKALALIAIGGMAGWKYGLEILFDLR